ncbi:MAG TPA: citrate transporter [Anaerolineae bacterium]|nr:citrate transporter [Anaerolineae bacterium]
MAALIATFIFVLVFVAISFHLLHETAAALLGAVAVFLVTYIGGSFVPDLHILSFDDAMTFVDWNVIFLILGMMIFMAVLAETNIFKWMAFQLYRLSKGNTWRLVAGLLLLTAVGSAFLNDVTVVLLLVPLSIQISVAIGIHPFVLVIPEVLISNIGGAATLIGNPPSTIVGSHIGVSFTEYLVNMAPIAVICMLAAMIVNRIQYRKEYKRSAKDVSPVLVEALASDSRIKNRSTLYKALAIAALTFAGFFVADFFDGMPPGVVALSGAVLLVAWVRPEMHKMLREVDWTTLLFFIGLFIVVGGMEKTGAIEWLATRVAIIAGESVKRAALLTTWVAGIASGIVANIPFTVAALPVADFLTETIPQAAESGIIYWGLILGADLGGNATILGSAPNIVALGLLGQAGFRLTFGRFLRDALPVTITTMVLASIWLLIRY